MKSGETGNEEHNERRPKARGRHGETFGDSLQLKLESNAATYISECKLH